MSNINEKLIMQIDDFKNAIWKEHNVLLDIRQRKIWEIESLDLGEIVLTASNVFMNDPTIPDNLKEKGLFSDNRRRELVTYRQAVYIIARTYNHSLQSIADVFGKNHATVLHGVKTIQSLLDTNDKQTIIIYNRLKDGIKIKFRNDGHVRPDN